MTTPLIGKDYISKIVGEKKDISIPDIPILQQEDAVKLAENSLKGMKNLKIFCENNNLCYNSVVAIRKGRGTKYPLLVKQILQLLCGIETTLITAYRIDDIIIK